MAKAAQPEDSMWVSGALMTMTHVARDFHQALDTPDNGECDGNGPDAVMGVAARSVQL